MASRYRLFAQHIKLFIDSNFKPFSELIDCRRYSFPKQSILKRFLRNLEYFSYNYIATAILTSLLYLVYNIWFIVGLSLTVGFWGVAYRFRQKIIEESPNDMCFNAKMTFFLITNLIILWLFYSTQIAEYIGFITFPIVLHSILFEPIEISEILSSPNIQSNNNLDMESQQQGLSVPQTNNQSVQYNQISIQESSSQIIQQNKMSDEQAQAYQHVISVENSTNRCSDDSQH